MSYIQYRVEIAGDTLIMHNGQTADPLNAFSKAMKTITSSRKKTDADHEKLAEIEFRAGLYLNAAGAPIVPSRVIEAMVAEGARKTKEGKLALSGLFVDTDLEIAYAGGPLTVDQLAASAAHRLTVGVKVGQARVMRTRPLFTDWSGSFLISVNSLVANESQAKRWIVDAAGLVGLGDWRPRHGRFTVQKFEQVQVPLKMAA